MLKQSEYPTELKIGDEEYRVAFVASIDGTNTIGLCDSGNKVIHIQKGLSKEETLQTFIHEVIHSMEFEYNIKISHRSVYKFETAIYNFIKDNF